LPLIAFDRAWQQYRRAEVRLPLKPPPVTPERVGGVLEVLDRIDLVILDAWGVLNLGEEPIPRARERVAMLRRMGVPILVLSNDGSGDKAAAVARHRRRGYDFTAAEIHMGLDLMPEALRGLSLRGPLGVISAGPPPALRLSHPLSPLGEDAAAYDRMAGFLFLESGEWSEARQDMLRASFGRRPRPLLVGNPDIASPGGGMLAAEPGYYAHRLADELGLAPVFCGKPFGAIYEQALAQFPRLRRERVLCVGDTLHTDILGARAAGCRAMLVEDGFCAGRDALALAADCGIWPDFVAPGI
jgi:HAD superfamily hydrolase (TIGR01450 family)